MRRIALVGTIVCLVVSCGETSGPNPGDTEIVGIWDASLSEISGVDGSGRPAECTIQWVMAVSNAGTGVSRSLLTTIPFSATSQCGSEEPRPWSQVGRELTVHQSGASLAFLTTSSDTFLVAEVSGSGRLSGSSSGQFYPGARFAAIRRSSSMDPNRAPFEVVATVEFRDVDVGDSVTARARALDAYRRDTTVGMSWSSSAPDIATVTDAGVVHGVAPGQVTIAAAVGEIEDTLHLVVLTPPASIEITQVPDSLIEPELWTLIGVARDAGGRVLPGRRLHWTSSDTVIASVSELGATGVVTARGAGTVTVTARAASVTGTATIEVLAKVDKVEIGGGVVVPIGGSVQLTATPRDASDNPLPGRPVAWSSDQPDVMTVNADGLLTGHRGGQATITAAAANASNSMLFFAQMDGRLTSVAAGSGHTCGLTEAGTIYCWGRGDDGQLGPAHITLFSRPVRIESDEEFASLDTRAYHTCALNQAGAAFCWGWNEWGQLGQPAGEMGAVETVSGGLTFTALAVGGSFTCALSAAQDTFCWGSDWAGALGRGTSVSGVDATPGLVVGGHKFTEITAGAGHTCGLTATGEAWCWGSNESGALGLGTMDEASHPTPARAAAGLTFTALAASTTRTCGISSAGPVFCWGEAELTPTMLDPSDHWVKITGGHGHFCRIDDSDRMSCFGEIQDHNLGHEPVSAIAVFSAGMEHTCAIPFGVRAVCWGLNTTWQLGVPEETAGPVEAAGQRD